MSGFSSMDVLGETYHGKQSGERTDRLMEISLMYATCPPWYSPRAESRMLRGKRTESVGVMMWVGSWAPIITFSPVLPGAAGVYGSSANCGAAISSRFVTLRPVSTGSRSPSMIQPLRSWKREMHSAVGSRSSTTSLGSVSPLHRLTTSELMVLMPSPASTLKLELWNSVASTCNSRPALSSVPTFLSWGWVKPWEGMAPTNISASVVR